MTTTRTTAPGVPPGEQQIAPARPRRRLRLSGPRRRGILALVLVGVAAATIIQSFSWNQTSHYALIRALGNGTTAIDKYQGETGDKARFEGHWYSSRAPGLAIYALPWYGLVNNVGGRQLASWSQAQRNDDEMIWEIGLWGNVLPAILMLLIVRYLGERVAPGYGTAAGVTLGLGTLVLPFSTMLFSHVLTAMLGIAAFALLWRDRDGPRRMWRVVAAGLLVGFAMTAEYPLLFVGVSLGLYLLFDRDLGPRRSVTRALAFAIAAAVGVIPLALYDLAAFGSVFHVAYADLPPHQSGFFGIRPPSLGVTASLLFSSRGLLTLTPVIGMAIPGLVLLWRAGRRAETAVISAVAVLYLAYNSGYYLPFGGAVPGPRFLITMLPFLAVPLALAYRRYPSLTLSLAAISALTMILATVTHPLVGYQPETSVWTRYAANGFFQPTIVSAFGAGRGWVAEIPFIVATALALALAAGATPPLGLHRRSVAIAAAAAAVWALAASTLPALLGIDAATERRIAASGDPMVVRQFGTHPLVHLCLVAFGTAVIALVLARVATTRRGARVASAPA